MYQIDNDYNPPVIAANLTCSKGQKQTLSLTIPKTYYEANSPIGYIYANTYGGKAEVISYSGDYVIITAYSKQGSNILENARVNPSNINNVSSVQNWLTSLCSLGTVASSYAGNSSILSSNPYIYGLTVTSLLGALGTITNCYGIDYYHISTTQGDSIKFIHPSATVTYTLDSYITSLSYSQQDTDKQQYVIVKTAPIEQHEEIPLSVERQTQLQKTSQNHPYLEAEVEYNEINRYWDGKITTFDYSELHGMDKEITIADPADMDSEDTWYRSYFVYSPYFGDWLKVGHDTTADQLYRIIVGGSTQGGDTTEERIEQIDSIPETGVPYEHYTEQGETEEHLYFGVWSTNRPYSYATWDSLKSTWYLHPVEGRPNPWQETDHDTQIKDFGGIYPDPPYAFFVNFGNSQSRMESDYNAVLAYGQYSLYKYEHTETDGEDNITAYTPTPAQYPWNPTIREAVSSQITRTEDDIQQTGRHSYTTTQALTVSKALFDAEWDDFVKPPTIDEAFLENGSLSNIRLDKSSERWFNAEAAPAEDRQFRGLDCVQNWKYKLANSQEKIYLQAGHEPGRLTARWLNGTMAPQYYNLQRGMSLNRIFVNNSTVQCTFISSSQKTFSTAPYRQNDKTYTITGSVWRDKATALLCIPYITRQHENSRQITFSIPFSLISINSAVELLGTTNSIKSEKVYITAINADFRSELVSYSGYVIPE